MPPWKFTWAATWISAASAWSTLRASRPTAPSTVCRPARASITGEHRPHLPEFTRPRPRSRLVARLISPARLWGTPSIFTGRRIFTTMKPSGMTGRSFASSRGRNCEPRSQRMKTGASFRGEHGSVLVITLVIALLVGLVVAALLFVAQQQNYMTARSKVWCSEIPLAEAGIEEAITHIVSLPGDLAANGWEADGTNYVKRREFTNGYFYTTIIPTSTNTNTIVSVGFARIPLQTNYSQRTVMAILKQRQSAWGFVAKRDIVL